MIHLNTSNRLETNLVAFLMSLGIIHSADLFKTIFVGRVTNKLTVNIASKWLFNVNFLFIEYVFFLHIKAI